MKAFILVSLYDKKAKIWKEPFPIASLHDFERSMISQLRQPSKGSLMHEFPDDFAAYISGTFNVDTGTIDPMIPPAFVSEVRSYHDAARSPEHER